MSRTGVVGGTFDVLHDGHHALLTTAFSYGGHVRIGLTSQELADSSREREVKDYSTRKEELINFCRTYENIFNATFEVNAIKDPFRPAVNTDADFIVISPEKKTQERVIEINRKRQEKEKNRLQVIEAPMVSDYKGRRISATRIRENEIDRHGNEI